jgi:glycosyltransferase involved in cell wall biosynthesis
MKFSVIIPTRNRPDLLTLAVASVCAQSHRNIELIIVNDGSMPLPRFDDPRIRAFDSGQRGAVPARNLGLAQATGSAVAWLDDDDQWSDLRFLADATAALTGGADLVHGDGRFVFADGRPPEAYSRAASATSLKHDNTILVSALCYRASLHQELGSFDESLPYYWDWDWYLRVAAAGARLFHLARPVADILIHPQNMSGDDNAGPRQENLTRLAMKHAMPTPTLKTHRDLA